VLSLDIPYAQDESRKSIKETSKEELGPRGDKRALDASEMEIRRGRGKGQDAFLL